MKPKLTVEAAARKYGLPESTVVELREHFSRPESLADVVPFSVRQERPVEVAFKEFLSVAEQADPRELEAMLAERPEDSGMLPLLAAAAEWLADRSSLVPPSWTAAIGPCGEGPRYWDAPERLVNDMWLQQTPRPFLDRGIVIDEASLIRV